MTPEQTQLVSQIRSLGSWLSQPGTKALLESQAKLKAQIDAHLVEISNHHKIDLAYALASPKQLAFAAAFHARAINGIKKTIFVALGGNRAGKTQAGGVMCFAHYLRDTAKDGDHFWCVAPNFDKSVMGQQKELWEALPRSMFGEEVWNPKGGFGQHRRIVLKTKRGRFIIEFRSSDQAPSTFETAKLRGIWADERLPEELYDRLLARIIDTGGFLVYTDIPEQWWHQERLVGAAPDSTIHVQHFSMYDNQKLLPPGAIEEAAALWSSEMQQMRIWGNPIIMEGVVYKEFQDSHIIKPFKIPDYWPRWRLIDYGSSAPTACLWVALGDSERCYAYREWYDKGHSVEYNAKHIIDLSGAETYRCTLMDPHAIDAPPAVYGMAPTVATQYRQAGIKAVGWPYIQIMGEHACVQRVKYRLEHGQLVVFNTLHNLIREFKSWKYDCDKEGKPKAADSYTKENNHLLDDLKGFFATNPTFAPQRIEVVT